MRENYKVNEIAKIFNISRRTLIYYDEIDLFKPNYIDEENGYRYYSEHQVYILRFIITLKNSGFSLDEIKRYTNCKDIEEGKAFLENKVIQMKSKIKELEKSIEIIEGRCNELDKAVSDKGLTPSLDYNKKINAITIDVEKPHKYIEVEKAHKKLSEIEKNLNLDKGIYIAIVSKDMLNRQNTGSLKSIGLIVPEITDYKEVSVFSLKKYVTITHKDSFASLKNSYDKLFDFIEENSYVFIGDSIEISHEGQIQLEKGVGEVIEILIPVR